MTLLRIDDLHLSFGGVKAINGVSIPFSLTAAQAKLKTGRLAVRCAEAMVTS